MSKHVHYKTSAATTASNVSDRINGRVMVQYFKDTYGVHCANVERLHYIGASPVVYTGTVRELPENKPIGELVAAWSAHTDVLANRLRGVINGSR